MAARMGSRGLRLLRRSANQSGKENNTQGSRRGYTQHGRCRISLAKQVSISQPERTKIILDNLSVLDYININSMNKYEMPFIISVDVGVLLLFILIPDRL
jgi:hypothetical protein